MKYAKQFCIILLFSFLGELLHLVLPLPVPASVYGLLLLLAALCAGVVKTEQIQETSKFLIEIMPVMFIPAAVGLLTVWEVLQPIWVPVIVITILTTVLVMAVTGLVTQSVIRSGKKGEEQEK